MNRIFDRRVYYDERSRDFPIRTLLAEKQPRSYTWYCPVRLDQGNEGACVGFAWMQELGARPRMHTKVANDLARSVYLEAQQVDIWPETPPEQGTSVLAGAQTMQKHGYLGEYRWCFSLNDLKLAVGYAGPVVLGIWWWTDMLNVDSAGYIYPRGAREGGHAILCNSYSVTKRRFNLVNSWGTSWGRNGGCYVYEEDMEFLLNDEGEACVPVTRTWIEELR